MKNLPPLMAIGFILMAGCATPPPPPKPEPVVQPSAVSPPPQNPEPKKERALTLKIPRITKETALFADGTADEYRIYTYSPDGKLLLKEELFDANSRDILETVTYSYKDSYPVERVSWDREKKFKGKKTFSYLPGGLMESESIFDKNEAVQAVSRFAYDGDGNRVEWKTLDTAGVTLGTTKYEYEKKRLSKILLLGPAGKLDLEITLFYDNQGRKVREVFGPAPGKTEKEIVYAYDAKGRLISETTLSPNKVSLAKTTFEYSGDDEVPSKINHLDGRERLKKSILQEFAFREEKKVIYE